MSKRQSTKFGQLFRNMSLASHFTKKTSKRKEPRINLLIVDKQSTEKSKVSINKPIKKKIESQDARTDASETRNEEKAGPFSFNFHITSSSNEKDNKESKSAPFVFDFHLEGSDGSKIKNRKRRNRHKKKKKKKIADDSETDGYIETAAVKAMHMSTESSGAVGPLGQQGTEKESFINIDKSLTPKRVGLESKTFQEVESKGKATTKQSKRAFAIRTPPGFTSLGNVKGLANYTGTNNTVTAQAFKAGSNSREEYIQAKDREERTIYNVKQNTTMKFNTSDRGRAIVNKNSLAVHLKKNKQNSIVSCKDNLFSFGFGDDTKQNAHIKFNTSDSGRAMVNHTSLAVHKEKSKEKSIDVDEHNAFSFGFSFDSLLKDYL